MVSMTCPDGWHPAEKCWTVPERPVSSETNPNDERLEEYAKALNLRSHTYQNDQSGWTPRLQAVMAVADAERAELLELIDDWKVAHPAVTLSDDGSVTVHTPLVEARLSSRVDQYRDRTHKAEERAEAAEAKVADAWDEGAEAVRARLATFGSAASMPSNPYRALAGDA